ncbi:MAG: flagellar type III secretion system pore protein FliP [Anaerolineae bacterium]|nr:flagellar type III secretion system pore protein FliP [Anaerolineae bacterium]MDW8099693.1 flagellar type III secretion system pore protein FliP [Anaerolineae bacterium]
MSFRTGGIALILAILFLAVGVTGCVIRAEDAGSPDFDLRVSMPGNGQELVAELQLLIMLTTLALVPAILIVTTAFIRITVVLSILRNAIGLPQLPPNQVIIALSLFLTFFVMNPVWEQVNRDALQPFIAGTLSQQEAMERGMQPIREFMLKQAREEDLALFIHLAQLPRPRTADDVPTYALIPAFVISELRTAFQMAFVVYIPFLVVDMVVSSALMSMGMMMLPPTVISLPFKLLLFVMVDGWHLVVRSLVMSFHV